MKKILKITGISILIILILLIVMPFIFKGKIIEIAKTEINKQVDAKVDFGTFDLSIFTYFPQLNFEINDLVVSGIGKFEGDTLMSLQQFSAKVDLMSVMGDEIKILGIHLIHPTIYAHVLADSTANWDIAKASTDTIAEETVEDTTSTSFKMNLQEFSIKKANIVYNDETTPLKATIKDLDYTLSGDMSLTNVELKMATLIDAITVDMQGVKYLNKAQIAYDADINADMEHMKFELKENKFRINQFVMSLIGYLQMNDDESYDMDLQFGTNKNKFKDLLSLVPATYTKDYKNIKTSGELALSGFAKGQYSEKTLPAFNLTLNVNKASVQYPDLPAAVKNIFINLNIDNKDGVDDHTVINLKNFSFDVAGNPIAMHYITKTPISDPYIDGAIKGKLDFDKLKEAIPLDSMEMHGIMTMDLAMKGNMSTIEKEDYENFDATGRIGLENFIYKSDDLDYDVNISSTNFEVAPKYFTLKNFDAKVGKSDFHADGQIDNFLAYYFKEEVLKGTFNLKSNLIDANEFMSEEEIADANETKEEPVDTTPMTVVELPKNIDFTLNTKLNKILYDTYEIDNFYGKVQLKEGVAQMSPVSMNMIGGNISMDGTYDSRDIENPAFDFDFKLSDIDIQKAFITFNTIQKIAPLAKNCEGKISMSMHLASLLDEHMELITKTMNGKGMFSSNNIELNNSEGLAKMAAIIHSDKYKQLNLKNIKTKFSIKDGDIIVEPFDVKINNSKAQFGGKQGVAGDIDYVLNMNIPTKDLGENANVLMNDLISKGGSYTKGMKTPENIKADIFMTGTLQKPHFSMGAKDLTSNVKEQVVEQVKEKVKETVDKAKKKAIEEAKKKAAQLNAEAEKQAQKLITEANAKAKLIREKGKKAAELIRKEAKKQADDLIKQAGINPIKKTAAKIAGDKLIKEADKKATKTEQEANKKADQLISTTQKKSDALKKKAKDEGDKLITKAEQQ
jgi:uncharacterized protein involved in outer membrane biogenesis